MFAGMPERAAPPPGSVAALLIDDLRQLGMHRYKVVRQYAQPVMERALKRFPGAVVPSLTPLLAALTDPAHGELEEAAVGACTALGGRVLCRHTTRLPAALAQVLLARAATLLLTTVAVLAR